MAAGMKGKGESVNHFNGVRLRILGDGELDIKIMSLPDKNGVKLEVELVPLDMDNIITGREPFKKTNFSQQRAQYEFSTDEINEYFKINRMAIFLRPVASNYPG